MIHIINIIIYHSNYYNQFFKNCFNGTSYKVNVTNTIKNRLPSLAIGIFYLLTKLFINPTPNKQSYKPN